MDIESVTRMSRDIRAAATTLSADEARFLVDSYYQQQENRIRSSHQVRTNGRRSRALNEDDIAIVARALRDGNL